MPQFELKQEEGKVAGYATFDKKEDWVTIKVKGDKNAKPELVHKILGEKLVAKGLYVEAKDVNVEETEVNNTVIVDQERTKNNRKPKN